MADADSLLHADTSEPRASDSIARYLCTKHSWRGKYRRLLCVTPTALVTVKPDNLVVTNSWQLDDDPDIDGITIGSFQHGDELEFSILARQDKKSKFKAQKFTCKHRASFLTLLHRTLSAAAAAGHCPIAAKITGSSAVLGAYRYDSGHWPSTKLGIKLTAEMHGGVTASNLASAIENAERERAASPDEVPIAEWEVQRVQRRGPSLAPATRPSDPEQGTGSEIRGARLKQRRLTLTPAALLERSTDTYEVAERRQLQAIASLVRLQNDPQLLCVEWADGLPASEFKTAARDDLLAALLNAAQDAAGRPIPVLPQRSNPGLSIIANGAVAAFTPPAQADAEVEKLCLAHLASTAKDASVVVTEVDSTGPAPAEQDILIGAPSAINEQRKRPGVLNNLAGSFTSSRARPASDGAPSGPISMTPVLSTAAQNALAGFRQSMAQLNACVPFAGLAPGAHVEEGVVTIMLSMLPMPIPLGMEAAPLSTHQAAELITTLQCLQRCAACPPVAAAIANTTGAPSRVFAALSCGQEHVSAEAARLLVRLWNPAAAFTGCPTWRLGGRASTSALHRDNPDAVNTAAELAAARSAKVQCLSGHARCVALVGVLRGERTLCPYTTMVGIEALAAATCEPGASSTDPMILSMLLSEAADLGHHLFSLFVHPARRAVSAAAAIMRAIAEGGTAAAAPMREAALTQGALLHHLHTAVLSQGLQAAMSQDLVGLWADEYGPAIALLRRIFPAGLMRYLSVPRASSQPPPTPSTQATLPAAADPMSARPTSPKLPVAPPAPKTASSSLKGNWEEFWRNVRRDHAHAGLIWNERTRAELRDALQAGELSLKQAKSRARVGTADRPAWNHWEFSVTYASLSGQLCVAGTYVRLLLEGADKAAVEKLAAPKEVFSGLFHRLLTLGDASLLLPSQSSKADIDDSQRVLCVRAMAVIYRVHGGAIGPFDGTGHLTALLDRTMDGSLRHALLGLLEALVALPAAGMEDAAMRAARANGRSFVEAGGLELAVDLVACAHSAQERTQTPLQTNLISYNIEGEEVKEWHISTPEDPRHGPLTKHEVKRLLSLGKLTMQTRFWAQGMLDAQPMEAIRELRWDVSGRGALGPFQAAEVALRLLQSLAQLQPAMDGRGCVVLPPPMVHRHLASDRCLPHLAQVILTGEPGLVSLAASLLENVLQHNIAALATLYQTGIYFFGLAYCGSNLSELARLFKVSHAVQHSIGSSAPGLGKLALRSYLGSLLPESLLYILETYGPGSFATALAGDTDNPEIIWTHRMRGQRLVPQMLHHIGSLPQKLAQRNHTVYDYVDCPPVSYPELTDEIWCHRYYLRNLCNTERFGDWNIVDHVPFLQTLLEEWRAELARKPLAMSEADACQVLGVTLGEDGHLSEDALKGAYRRLARQFHPDKNPEGRDKFMAVQKAYERLQAGSRAGQGPQPWRLQLLLKAQCILFRRYPQVLEPFKYAGYPMLLQAVTLPEDELEAGQGSAFLGPEQAPQLQAAVELCWLTCVSSRLNGEELTRSGGVDILGRLLIRCCAVMPWDTPAHLPAAVISTQTLRAFAGMAAFDNARQELATQEYLVGEIVRCCSLERATSAVDAALLSIIQMAASAQLQGLILKVGVLGHVMPLLFSFDATFEEGDTQLPLVTAARTGPSLTELASERPTMQAARNHHAMLAVRVLARLVGVLPGSLASPPNGPAAAALSSLLTPSLAEQLADMDPRPLLSQLTGSVRSPHTIWDGRMREELLGMLEAMRGDPAGTPLPNRSFQYKALEGELVVAGVFVRLYNEQADFPIPDPPAFCKSLVAFINMESKALPSSPAMSRTSSGRLRPKSPGPPERGDASVVAKGIGKASWKEDAQTMRRRHLVEALLAFQNVLEAHQRLAALMASRSALAPLLNCIEPACRRMHAAGSAPLESTVPGGNDKPADSEVQRQHEVEIAGIALAALVRLTRHAGCVEAMAEDRTLLLAGWVLHRPPIMSMRLPALLLLVALAPMPAAAWSAAAHAGALFILTTLLPSPSTPPAQVPSAEEKTGAALLLSRLMRQALHGPRVTLSLSRLLPPGLITAIHDGPGEAAVAALEQESETPERMWTRSMAFVTAEELAALGSAARTQQVASGRPEWALLEGSAIHFDELKDELFLGGVYVRLFLANPQFPLRQPNRFLEALVQSYTDLLQGQANTKQALLLSAAAVALLQNHPFLADHAVSQGYMPKLLKQLSARLPAPPASQGATGRPSDADETGGSILRLLHQLSTATTAAEALARAVPSLVPMLMAAMAGWGLAGSVLSLETLQRGLALENRARDLLVGGALSAGLIPNLLTRLDWRDAGAGGASASGGDNSVERVLTVAVLHLLAADGPYAGAVQDLLDKSDVWAAYRDQRHDLFLPAGDSSKAGMVGLLKGSEITRFALPAPDSVTSSKTSSSAVPPEFTSQPSDTLAAAPSSPLGTPRAIQPSQNQPFGGVPASPTPTQPILAAKPTASAPAASPDAGTYPSESPSFNNGTSISQPTNAAPSGLRPPVASPRPEQPSSEGQTRQSSPASPRASVEGLPAMPPHPTPSNESGAQAATSSAASPNESRHEPRADPLAALLAPRESCTIPSTTTSGGRLNPSEPSGRGSSSGCPSTAGQASGSPLMQGSGVQAGPLMPASDGAAGTLLSRPSGGTIAAKSGLQRKPSKPATSSSGPLQRSLADFNPLG
ncbi:hypothetical protein WJX84_004951 [Apatococcus fuscideae]|uniref:J domain-containing protein n=1 Tax=Apatococcus fuscideae TaxID=2026836 RepID=A0AAW1TG95_9CHLO